MSNEFSVNFWGSKPGTNDDCHTVVEFKTLDAAMTAFESKPGDVVSWLDSRIVAYVEIVGPTFSAERKNRAFAPTPDNDSEARSEFAIQSGMAFGCAGYNDAIGA